MRKLILVAWLIFGTIFAPSAMANENDVEKIKENYSLQRHSEGGYFAEIYTAPFKSKGRATAGSIYFLLDKDDVSHFHRLDCDEIWFYHAGCGMKIISLRDGKLEEFFLGINPEQKPMIVIPKGSIFAVENIDKSDFTFVSCVTTPHFTYKGFRLVLRSELKKLYPHLPKEILQMAYEKIPTP